MTSGRTGSRSRRRDNQSKSEEYKQILNILETAQFQHICFFVVSTLLFSERLHFISLYEWLSGFCLAATPLFFGFLWLKLVMLGVAWFNNPEAFSRRVKLQIIFLYSWWFTILLSIIAFLSTWHRYSTIYKSIAIIPGDTRSTLLVANKMSTSIFMFIIVLNVALFFSFQRTLKAFQVSK